MIENSKSPSNCCKFCGWEFNPDFIQRIIENKQAVVCEFCGIEINISSVNNQEGFSKEKFAEISNTDNDTEKKKNSIVKNIKKRIQPKKYSISLISEDEDFPKIFKENLTIVISRLTYLFIRDWEQENNVSVDRVSLEKHILIYFLERISPILEKRVHSKFLNNLFKINREDFEYWLKLLQKKIDLDQKYQTHFKFYLTWLIKIVFKLVSDMWDMKNLPKFQATILKDLKNYSFYSLNYINSPKNVNSGEFSLPFEEEILIKDSNIKPEERSKIKIPHFEQKIIENLKNLHSLIDCTAEQEEFIWAKSLEILDEFILRAENGEFTIRKDANLSVIATTIVYTVIVSKENMPKISISQLSGLYISQITNYYRQHFKRRYPRLEFHFGSYNFKKFRKIFSLYFFELLIKNLETETSGSVLCLRENILKNINLPEQLTDNDIEVLRDLATQYDNFFINYFSDLAEIVRQLIISSKVFKKIGASLIIKYIADTLEKRGINLFMQSSYFSRSIIDIFDFLKKIYPDFFPPRSYTQKRHNEYRKIVGSKLKLFIIREILKNKECKCPECLKEGLLINTDISRLKALQLHHFSGKVEKKFSAKNLYEIFTNNLSNPYFLEELINQVEKEKLILLCNNHHTIFHDKYYRFFKYLISWENIFSYPPEIIHMLIRISVDTFRETRKLTIEKKKEIRRSIKYKLKKRYIIEQFYGENCHICGELSTKKHLSAFQFAHLNEELKTLEPSSLYRSYSCSEIARILVREKGGYICGNCHSVIHYDKYIPLLDKIFDNKSLIKKIFDDYKCVIKKFTIMSSTNSIGDPLKTSNNIYDSLERYLTAIHKNSKSGRDVTTSALADYLKISISPVHSFFRKWSDLLRQYISIIIGRGRKQSIYILTDKGKELISLIYHFKDYYKSL